MQKVAECARELPPLIDALVGAAADDLIAGQARVAALESEADAIKNDLRSTLPRRLLLPVDRRDLLEVLDLQDSVADCAEDVGDLLVLRTWVVPPGFREPLSALVASVVECAEAAARVMANLDGLLSAAFSGPEVKSTEALIADVLRLEDEADAREAEFTRVLFEHEDEVGPVGVLMWLRLIELLGDVADYSKKACNRLRLVIAR
jgi:predicted phosphate transport protein (TIGR00153 family)